MIATRRVLGVVLVVIAELVQVTGFNRLDTPGSPPQLALVVVLVLALLEGPAVGMAFGFGGGLLGDALAVHAFGRLALVWTVAAYLAGLLHDPGGRAGERSPVLPVLAVPVLVGLAQLGYAGLDVVSGSAHDSAFHLVRAAVAVGVYALVLAPLVYVVLRPTLGRLAPVDRS